MASKAKSRLFLNIDIISKDACLCIFAILKLSNALSVMGCLMKALKWAETSLFLKK